MPGSEPTLFEALADSKLRPLLQTWSKRLYFDDQMDFLMDVNAHRPNKYLYETYIAPNVPKAINLQSSSLKPLRELAKEGDTGYAKMSKAMGDAFEETMHFIGGTYSVGKDKFLESVEYQGFVNAGRTPAVAKAMTALKLTGAKAATFQPLLEVYLKARTAEDAYQAYLAMQKTVSKSKLDPALTAAGKPAGGLEAQVAAAKAKQKADLLAHQAKQQTDLLAHQAAQLLPAIKTDLATAKTYFTSALATLKTKGKPASSSEVTRMFNSGRQRMENLNNNYVKAVKLDKSFTTKNATLAADKKKVDEQWAAYRKALGK